MLAQLIQEARLHLEQLKQTAFVFVERDGFVLLLKRSATVGRPGLWNPPGGTVEPGETPEKAAAREAAEEAGIQVGPLRLLARVPRNDFADDFFFHTTEFAGKPIINDESSDIRWVSIEKVPLLQTIPGVEQALAALR